MENLKEKKISDYSLPFVEKLKKQIDLELSEIKSKILFFEDVLKLISIQNPDVVIINDYYSNIPFDKSSIEKNICIEKVRYMMCKITEFALLSGKFLNGNVRNIKNYKSEFEELNDFDNSFDLITLLLDEKIIPEDEINDDIQKIQYVLRMK